MCIRKIFFEVEDISDVGVAPFINALIGIAYHAEVARLMDTFGDFVLRLVGILIFIDQDASECLSVPHGVPRCDACHRGQIQ